VVANSTALDVCWLNRSVAVCSTCAHDIQRSLQHKHCATKNLTGENNEAAKVAARRTQPLCNDGIHPAASPLFLDSKNVITHHTAADMWARSLERGSSKSVPRHDEERDVPQSFCGQGEWVAVVVLLTAPASLAGAADEASKASSTHKTESYLHPLVPSTIHVFAYTN
jgi:hypothetical protein